MLRLSGLRKIIDVAVIGAGHAGVEAAAAAHRMGLKTKLFTHKKSTIGEMSCNPSFGGIGKGHLLREVDALDGIAPKILDQSGIFYRMLNKSSGPAVWGPRAQIDRAGYKFQLQKFLQEDPTYKDLEIVEANIQQFHVDDSGQISAISAEIAGKSQTISTKSVILCTGTFLNAETHYGETILPEGRRGEANSQISSPETNIFSQLLTNRSRTGTPPRVDFSTVNWHHPKIQKYAADAHPDPFSYLNQKPEFNYGQINCFTTTGDHKIFADIVLRSQHLNAHIQAEKAAGPTYCPSIESKVLTFGDKGDYTFWLEPEEDPKINPNCDVYIQGCSVTMPSYEQIPLIKAICGLENAKITKFGYGVEYAFLDPKEMTKSLMVKKISGLFVAGQICGTTGYEEAAALGVLAGANAGLYCQNKDPLTIPRSKGYLGVMVDDLTEKGVETVYRMFTSRSEYRLFLRQENADFRLTEYAENLCPGLISENRSHFNVSLKTAYQKFKNYLQHTKITLNKTENCQNFQLLADYQLIHPSKFSRKLVTYSMYQLLRQNYVDSAKLVKNGNCVDRFEDLWFDRFYALVSENSGAEIFLGPKLGKKRRSINFLATLENFNLKISDFSNLVSRDSAVSYRLRQKLLVDSIYDVPTLKNSQTAEIEKLNSMSQKKIPKNFDFSTVPGLKNIEIKILNRESPENFYDLSRLKEISLNGILMLDRYLAKNS